MLIFIGIIEILLFVVLVILGAINLERPNLSPSALRQKAAQNKKNTKGSRPDELIVYENYRLFNATVRLLYGLAVISLTILLGVTNNGWKAYLLAVALVYIAYLLSSVNFIKGLANSLVQPIQSKVLMGLASNKKWLQWFVIEDSEVVIPTITTPKELISVIDTKAPFLTKKQKVLLTNSVSFYNKKVKDVMVTKDKLVVLEDTALMGPLMLDKIYKKQQEYVLVVGTDREVAQGVLAVATLVEISGGQEETLTAGAALQGDACFISSQQTLDDALKVMANKNTAVLIVQDEGQPVAGLVTLHAIWDTLFK